VELGKDLVGGVRDRLEWERLEGVTAYCGVQKHLSALHRNCEIECVHCLLRMNFLLTNNEMFTPMFYVIYCLM